MAWIGLACLLALSVLAACGDSREPTPTSTPTAEVPTPAPIATPEPEPTATPEPEPAATPEPEPTATPEPEPTATPEPEPAATPEPEPEPTPTEEDTGATAQPSFEIDSDTLWGDLFAVFDETEQSCIRDELGGEFDSVLKRPVMSVEASQGEVSIFGCLSQETAIPLFLTALMQQMGGPGEEIVACLREALVDFDVAAFVAATMPGAPP